MRFTPSSCSVAPNLRGDLVVASSVPAEFHRVGRRISYAGRPGFASAGVGACIISKSKLHISHYLRFQGRRWPAHGWSPPHASPGWII